MCFKQRKAEGSPGVVVVENIEEFVRRDKQVLVYTLLDLLHREDMFIILVAVSRCCHLSTMFEKRVLSRLNPQTVYIKEPSSRDLCLLLSESLRLPEDLAAEGDRRQLEAFNRSVEAAFGDATREGALFGLVDCLLGWGRSSVCICGAVRWAVCSTVGEEPFALDPVQLREAVAGQVRPSLPLVRQSS